jgi:hypothetical protein
MCLVDGSKLCNNKGRTRTIFENRMIVMALKMLLGVYLRFVANETITINEISWPMIEKEVSENFKVKQRHVTEIRQQYFTDGSIKVFGKEKGIYSIRGAGASKYSNKPTLSRCQMQLIVDEVDKLHAAGKTVVNQLLRNFIRVRFNGATVSKSAMGRYMKQLGLAWKPVRSSKQRLGDYRMDLLRSFLIEFNNLYSIWIANPDDCDFIFVFTDESYIHQTHSNKCSYIPIDKKKECKVVRSSSKGQRLIIMHAITTFGPLCELDNNYPVNMLQWKGDTPHPTIRCDNKLTCEVIWKATSTAGDYHSNMNSDMFLLWTTRQLIPTFEKLHPGKKMVLICDNAAYHHKRELNSLALLNKKQVIDLCIFHQVEYIDIPYNHRRYEALQIDGVAQEEGVIIVGEFCDTCRVAFSAVKMIEHAVASRAFVPTLDELKVGLLLYAAEVKPHLLEDKVVTIMKEHGHRVLWTPPYSPDLQPIELFWAAGKNHAASKASAKISMMETVNNLREGWYGNLSKYDTQLNESQMEEDYNNIKKYPVDCLKLFNHCVEKANTKFIPLCQGLSGTMGNLIVDNNHVMCHDGIPIDLLLLNINRSEYDFDSEEFENLDI